MYAHANRVIKVTNIAGEKSPAFSYLVHDRVIEEIAFVLRARKERADKEIGPFLGFYGVCVETPNIYDDSCPFVSKNLWAVRREQTLSDVNIGAAYASRVDLNQHLPFSHLRFRNVIQREFSSASPSGCQHAQSLLSVSRVISVVCMVT